MKTTRKNLYEMYAGLMKCSDVPGEKFAYAVLKNRNIIDSEIRSHESKFDEKKDFLAFQSEMKEVVKSHAKKNALGEYETQDSFEGGKIEKKYVIKDQEKLDKDLVELRKKYDKAIKAREKQMADFQGSMEDEVEIEIHNIKKGDVPSNITANQLEGITVLVNG